MEQIHRYIPTNAPDYVKYRLKKWFQSPDFCAFAAGHKPKIKRKLRKPTQQDIIDSLAELEAAYLLICQGFSVEYEKYGTCYRSPDLSVEKDGMVLNVEVKRIRHSEDEIALDGALSEIKRGVEDMPSPFFVILDLDLEEKPGEGFREA